MNENDVVKKIEIINKNEKELKRLDRKQKLAAIQLFLCIIIIIAGFVALFTKGVDTIASAVMFIASLTRLILKINEEELTDVQNEN